MATRRVIDVLEELDAARRERGVALAVAAGLVVAALVARLLTFLGADFLVPDAGVWIALPAGLAWLFTAGSTALALRAADDGKAVSWVFLGNVVPPTVLCLPTVYGLMVSIPAGVVAYLLTIPLVLVGRAVRRGEPREIQARERLVGAAALVATTVLLAAVHTPLIRDDWEPAPNLLEHVAHALPLALTGLVGCALAVRALAHEVVRLRAADALAAGAKGWRAGPRVGGVREVRRFAEVGAGPMRAGVVEEPVGVLVASTKRAIAAASLTAVGAVALCVGAVRALR